MSASTMVELGKDTDKKMTKALGKKEQEAEAIAKKVGVSLAYCRTLLRKFVKQGRAVPVRHGRYILYKSATPAAKAA